MPPNPRDNLFGGPVPLERVYAVVQWALHASRTDASQAAAEVVTWLVRFGLLAADVERPARDVSPAWTGGSGPEIWEWAGAPGRVNIHWAGMGYELLYTPQPGRKYEALPFGARLERIRSQRSFDLVPLTVCVGEHHVTPHVGCILR